MDAKDQAPYDRATRLVKAWFDDFRPHHDCDCWGREATLVGRVTQALAAIDAERDAKLEQAEAERDVLQQQAQVHLQNVLSQHGPTTAMEDVMRQRDALIAAIQRGYCPDESCDRRSMIHTPHSPDCRVAPLLGGGKE